MRRQRLLRRPRTTKRNQTKQYTRDTNRGQRTQHTNTFSSHLNNNSTSHHITRLPSPTRHTKATSITNYNSSNSRLNSSRFLTLRIPPTRKRGPTSTTIRNLIMPMQRLRLPNIHQIRSIHSTTSSKRPSLNMHSPNVNNIRISLLQRRGRTPHTAYATHYRRVAWGTRAAGPTGTPNFLFLYRKWFPIQGALHHHVSNCRMLRQVPGV